jgi:hypothetical protein
MTTLLLLLSLLQGLTLRGTVSEGDRPVPDAVVTLVGNSGTLQTTSDKDGAFTFTQIQPGDFQLSAKRGKSIGRQSTLHVMQDMEGIGIVLRPLVSPLVMGNIKVEGDQPLPTPSPKIVIKYNSGTIAGRYDSNERGLFFFSVSPTEFTVALEGLKEPYFVKSIMLGDIDLTKVPVKLPEMRSLQPMIVTLGIHK